MDMLGWQLTQQSILRLRLVSRKCSRSRYDKNIRLQMRYYNTELMSKGFSYIQALCRSYHQCIKEVCVCYNCNQVVYIYGWRSTCVRYRIFIKCCGADLFIDDYSEWHDSTGYMYRYVRNGIFSTYTLSIKNRSFTFDNSQPFRDTNFHF